MFQRPDFEVAANFLRPGAILGEIGQFRKMVIAGQNVDAAPLQRAAGQFFIGADDAPREVG